MRIEQRQWNAVQGWSPPGVLDPARVGLVFAFGSLAVLNEPGVMAEAAGMYPGAVLFGCSTAGEIAGPNVLDGTLVLTAVAFDHTTVRVASADIPGPRDSMDAGRRAVSQLPREGLRHVLLLTDGIVTLGGDMARGLAGALPEGVTVTGGLAGDGTRFETTAVLWENKPRQGIVTVAGLYSHRLRVGHGTLGGWDPFGPERTVTRSEGSVLYELDGRRALEIYKEYLGKHARELPASAMHFPLSFRSPDSQSTLVRCVFSIDDKQKSMTFTGDIPQDGFVRFMRSNIDRLVDGAHGAAMQCLAMGADSPELALVVSCMGRRVVLKQRVEEELEVVADAFGPDTVLSGFYSYGELAPSAPGGSCELHNQTMTITTFSER